VLALDAVVVGDLVGRHVAASKLAQSDGSASSRVPACD
jgi:hypothetical protein